MLDCDNYNFFGDFMLMLNEIKLDKALSKDRKIQLLYAQAIKVSHQVFISRFSNNKLKNYTYNPKIAAEELGLDEELVGELINDYISQILNTHHQFDNLINNILELHSIDKDMKMIELRNLAHKNLGVAKNLRIEDACIILNDLMIQDDIEYLQDCVNALEACAFKLNPNYAFSVLQVIELKSSF